MFDWCSNVLVGSPLFLQGGPHWKSSGVILLITCAECCPHFFYLLDKHFMTRKGDEIHCLEVCSIFISKKLYALRLIVYFNNLIVQLMLAKKLLLGLFNAKIVMKYSTSTKVPPACPPPCPARRPCPGASSSWPASRPGRPGRRRWGPPSCQP